MNRPQTVNFHDAREAWRQGRRRCDVTATFRPGEVLHCPGWLKVPGYEGPCGWSNFGESVLPRTRVILRVKIPTLSPLPHPGTQLRCKACGSPLEKFIIGEAE